MRTTLLLFRNDLRIHDNEALYEASKSDRLIPVYIFDPRKYSESKYGFPRVGPHRIRFLLETIENLRKNLQDRNSDLITRMGKPEEILPELVREFEVNEVFMHAESTSEETNDEEAIESALKPHNVDITKRWGSTLYHRDDVPFEQHQIPDVFTQFRKKLEKQSEVRKVISIQGDLPQCPVSEVGELPKPEDLRAMPDHFLWDDETFEAQDKSVLQFRGGEDEALARVKDYIWDGDHLKNYKKTRNGLLGTDYSSKFSPWLAVGALSARYIFAEVKKYEKERKKNSSTYWMIFELIWRDYFRFVFLKHRNALFKTEGIREMPHPIEWEKNDAHIRKWQLAETGIPFVDANMEELLNSGFMSNRGRQNAASFFSWNLRQEWRIGAAWFESLLIDYDPCSNWGNWAYNSGVGNDPRQRHFNILGQADRYDSNGDFVRHWLPEIADLPKKYIHEPHKLPKQDQQKLNFTPDADYPNPMINLEESYERIKG